MGVVENVHRYGKIAVLLGWVAGHAITATAAPGTAGWGIFEKVRTSNLRGAAAVSAYPGVAGVFENPAALAFVDRQQLFFASEAGCAGDGLGGVAYASPGRAARYLAGLYYYSAGAAELNWISDHQVHTRSVALQRDAVGIFSEAIAARDDMYVGVSVKLAMSEVAEERSAAASALDAGLLWFPDEQWSFSAALLNVGAATRFIEQSSPLPSSLNVGCSLLLQQQEGYYLLPACTLRYLLPDQALYIDTAVRLCVAGCGIGAGYTAGREEGGLVLSFDVSCGALDFGYAYAPSSFLNPTHRLSIACRFNPAPRASAVPRLPKPVKKSAPAYTPWWER
jgi:hypothetical protein